MMVEKAHPQDVNDLPSEAELHWLIRKEFGIPYREYYYSCFEGVYVPEMIEHALKTVIGRIDQKVEDGWATDDFIVLITDLIEKRE